MSEAKPVIALIADGASQPAGQKTLEGVDALVRDKFPGHDVRWAFQATYMIEAFKRRGKSTVFERKVPLMEAADLFKTLAGEGVKKAAVQCVMVADSSFSQRAYDADKLGIQVAVGRPLMSSQENIASLLKGMAEDFGDGKEKATVLVGHGALKEFKYNVPFQQIDEFVRKNYKNVFLGTLHGPPGIDGVAEEVKKSGCNGVRFVSMMIATSEHITEDVMGEGPDSWKSKIGLPAEVTDRFVDYPVVKDYFVRSIGGLLKGL